MQFFRSALVLSLSMLSVSAIILDGVYKCPGLGYDLDANEVAQKVDSININAEKADWYDFEENGVKYQNHHLFGEYQTSDEKDVVIAVNEDKSSVKVSVFRGKELLDCQHIPAEDAVKSKGRTSKGSPSRAARR
ncbi:unnamed protein product [Blumeria hordei]|uniref:Uncharacterized protein n=1 Tax=Blumeria hordei TaxID=2867405 RepID=A0A383UKN4_BLUHO|nr:unnamed protein product [Blumeria hordei]